MKPPAVHLFYAPSGFRALRAACGISLTTGKGPCTSATSAHGDETCASCSRTAAGRPRGWAIEGYSYERIPDEPRSREAELT